MISPENLLIAVMMHARCVFNFTAVYYPNLTAELCFCSSLWSLLHAVLMIATY